MLKTFHLGNREYYMPWQLSGGQTQRVAIARALVNEPSIILADEPTGNLDSRASHIIMEELSDIHKRGNTIIMVTHNPGLTTYASRVITMLDGKIDTDTNDTALKDSSSTRAKKPLGKVVKAAEDAV
jgi:putative ABC transport system ATP-binding protein